eukprot:gene16636-18326_t
MNIEISRHSVRASKINNQEAGDKLICTGGITSPSTRSDAELRDDNSPANNNKEITMNAAVRPNSTKSTNEQKLRCLQAKYEEVCDKNKLFRTQLTSRDEILKVQITEMQRLKKDNARQVEARDEFKTRNQQLELQLNEEKWLCERLKQDIKDLQAQLSFEECYLQEQADQINLLESLLAETQKRYHEQSDEISQLRKQLDNAKSKLDIQIMDLQSMLAN